MEATLKYNLEELGDREAHLRAVKSLDLVLAVWDITQARRKFEKKYEEGEYDALAAVNDIFEEVSHILFEHNINLDELCT